MKRANKHQMSKTPLAPLVGGINVALPPEQIAPNEMQECVNFLFEANNLVGRGGLRLLYNFDDNIKSMFYDYDTNMSFVFLNNKSAYRVVTSNGSPQIQALDSVTGDRKCCCLKFQNKLFVASGGLLQYYDYNNENMILKTVTTSNVCDRLFYRWGRLGTTMVGSDNIYYSAVGDAVGNESFNAWEPDSNDDSTARWLEVGYGDSGDIIEIVPLATDIVAFKSNGKAYQITGDADFNTVQVVNVSNFTDQTVAYGNGCCATNLGNEVVFLSLRGLRSLTATQDYGNLASADIGDKFNPLLTTNLYEPEMWNMRRHKYIIIRPTASKRFFVVYNYNLNAATTLKFEMDIAEFLETKDDVFVAAGNGLYLWDDTMTTDNGIPIEYKFVPRDVISSDEILVKAIDMKLSAGFAGKATLKIGDRLSVDFPTNARRKVKCNHSCDVIHTEVTSNDRFYVNHITLDTVDL